MKVLEERDVSMQRLLLLSLVLIGIAVALLFFAVPTSRGVSSSPFSPPDITGEVRYTDGTPVAGASVTLNNTRTGDEVQTKTTDEGTWCINMKTTINARNGDEILITVSAPHSVEKKKSEILVVNTSELVQEVNFVFEMELVEGPPGLPGDGDGSSGDSSAGDKPSAGETRTNATATEETISEDQPSPSPAPAPSQIGERGNEDVAGESETPLPLKEEGEGKEGKRISGFQLMYAVSAGLIAIAALFIFIIRKLRLTGKGGMKKG